MDSLAWKQWRRPAAPLLSLAWTLGCSSQPTHSTIDPAGPVLLSVNTTPLFGSSGDAPAPLLEGKFHVGESNRWLAYDARYAVERGDVLQQADEAAAVKPNKIGGESLRQQLSASVPTFGHAPVNLGLSEVRGSQLSLAGVTGQQQRVAALSWTPRAVGVQLQWSPPRQVADVNDPLDCTLRGSVKLGLAAVPLRNSALRVSGRECDVLAPERGVGEFSVQSWAGAWLWGPATRQQALSFTMIDPLASNPSDAQTDQGKDHSRGYEVNLSQTRTLGRWVGDAAVGVRQVDDPVDDTAQRYLTGRASLRRNLQTLGVAASWERAADNLWFVPAAAAPADRFSLGLSLDRWLRQLWQTDALASTLNYRWVETWHQDSTVDGGSVYWSFSSRW